MNKNGVKYIVLFCVAGLLAYKSVYFKKLDAVKAKVDKIDGTSFARKFWDNQFKKAIDSAVSLDIFEDEFIKKGAQVTIDKYAHKQGVSDVAYMLMKFNGTVKEVSDNKIVLDVINSRTNSFVFNIGNYFGNAVRDATGLIKMDDFANTIEYNDVSSQLNQMVKNEVILPLKNKLKIKDALIIVGCIEIREGRIQDEILPVKIILNK
jgi:predicted lipoprotein